MGTFVGSSDRMHVLLFQPSKSIKYKGIRYQVNNYYDYMMEEITKIIIMIMNTWIYDYSMYHGLWLYRSYLKLRIRFIKPNLYFKIKDLKDTNLNTDYKYVHSSSGKDIRMG